MNLMGGATVMLAIGASRQQGRRPGSAKPDDITALAPPTSH
jgi:hypothetical protein